MKTKIANLRQLDILGNGSFSSDREILTAVLKRWRQALGYFSIFAAVPAILASPTSGARSDDAKRPEPSVAERTARRLRRLNIIGSNPAFLKRQSEFLLPHQRSSSDMVPAVVGVDDCPGRTIAGGNYPAAAPYIDAGDTTGANNTVKRVHYMFYSYYWDDTLGPDHVYTFTLTGRGQNPQIQVSTTSGTYRPLIYVLEGGLAGACPASTENAVFNELMISYSPINGGPATISNAQMNYLPLNVPLHLFIDSSRNDASGSGPYTIRMQDVTIAPAACSTAPLDCNEFFLRQQYRDFLNREPDPAGFAAWLALLNNCPPGDPSCDRIHVSGAFFQSPEFQERGYFVYRFYPVAFGRKPNHAEFAQDIWWVSGFLSDSQLEASKVQFITDFTTRAAFAAAFNGLSNTQYVDTLLSNAGITHPARDFWIAALGNATRTRAQVLREISESTEVYNKYYNQSFVVMQYFGYLRRQPDAQYLVWLAHLNATRDYRSMINGFINSAEYRARFAP